MTRPSRQISPVRSGPPVHEYVGVDDAIVIERLKDLGDLEDFVSQVADFVTRA